MRQAICSYAARAAEKLRGEHQYCRFVSAFVKTSPFALNEPYYGNSASLKLLTPTQDSRDIIAAATSCLDAIWKAGHRYQKAGVMLGDFYSQGVAQLNLFDELAPRHNSARLMQVLDQLNAKTAGGRLYFAGQDPAAVADEARDALAALHHAIRRPAPRQITRAILHRGRKNRRQPVNKDAEPGRDVPVPGIDNVKG